MNLETYTIIWNICIATLINFALISTLLFFNTKKKVFLFYFLYLFVLSAYIIFRQNPYNNFTYEFYEKFPALYFTISWYLQIIYHIFYFFFGLELLEIKKHSKSFYSLVKKILIGIFLVGTLVALTDLPFTDRTIIFKYYIYVHIPFILIFSIYFLYKIKQYKIPIYNFFLIAYILYTTMSLIALLFSIYNIFNIKYPVFFFNIGVTLETFILSYAIGINTKNIYQENIKYERKLRVTEETLKNQLIEKNEVLNQRNLNEQLKRKQLHLENELNRLKIISLKNQMNSHFIFNTLNSIKSYITQKKPAEAVVFVTRFSKFIRFILEYSDMEVSNLKRELNMIELYENIENMRFDNAIEFEINIDENIIAEQIYLPSMIFQPFVENAIWHGLLPKKNNRNLWIEAKMNKDSVIISIEDNGVGRFSKSGIPDGVEKTSKGLLIVNQKLNHFNDRYNTNISYEIEDLIQGTRIEMIIPIKK